MKQVLPQPLFKVSSNSTYESAGVNTKRNIKLNKTIKQQLLRNAKTDTTQIKICWNFSQTI